MHAHGSEVKMKFGLQRERGGETQRHREPETDRETETETKIGEGEGHTQKDSISAVQNKFLNSPRFTFMVNIRKWQEHTIICYKGHKT